MFKLPEPSDEQLSIIHSLEDHNVICDSVCGAGKTTLALHIALSFPDLDILLLTYNKRLKAETRNKIKFLSIGNMQVHSYHSFCVKYYDQSCYTDHEVQSILREKKALTRQIQFHLIIIDEAQDLTPIYYELVLKIVADDQVKPSFCIVGDQYQSIFSFNNSDYRIMINADQLFVTLKPWVRLRLSKSYRLTKQVTSFINDVVLDQDRIISNGKEGPKVEYMVCSLWDNTIFNRIVELLNHYNYDDIFILAPSVKTSRNKEKETPLRTLANSLTQKGIPIHVPSDDNQKVGEEEVLRGKMVFSTFHQVKGLERKAVVVFGFDTSYFEFFKKDANQKIVPNEIYVALSRSLETLILIQDTRKSPFLFLNCYKLHQTCNWHGILRPSKRTFASDRIKTRYVTDLVKYLPSNIISDCFSFFSCRKLSEKSDLINIPIVTQQGKLSEYVADLNGVAIPAYVEYMLSGKTKMTISNCKDMRENLKLAKKTKELNLSLNGKMNPEKLLLITTNYMTYRTGYNFRLAQIQSYKWLKQKDLNRCLFRLQEFIGQNSKHEIYLVEPQQIVLQSGTRLHGYADCIDQRTLYEFKCTFDLEKEYFIQLALYMYLAKETNQEVDRFVLFSILTGESYEISGDLEKLKEMVEMLIKIKNSGLETEGDETFVCTLKNDIKSRYE
jgi:hypothetical protein